MLVHRPFPGDEVPKKTAPGSAGFLAGLMTGATATPASSFFALANAKAWHDSVDAPHQSVQRWTGHPLHVVELSTWQWFKPAYE